ncbi:MAG TPA: ABC transporter permease [Spirochaetia bacterium]|nr:ABC transporter permease [Spirochaetia bacterium]
MAALSERLRRIDLQQYGSLFALIILFIASSLISPYFLQYQNVVNILNQVSYTGIIALGMTLVIVGGGIDLSVGSLAAFSGSLAVVVLNAVLPIAHSDGVAIAAAALVSVIVGTAVGAANGALITWGRVAPFIVTLGTMALFRSLSLYIGNAGEFRSDSDAFGDFGHIGFLYLPITVWVMVIMAAILSTVLYSTRYGRYVAAVGSNARVALYSAISVERTRFFTYLIIGFCTGISAFLLASRFNAITTSNAGVGFELDAIAAVIIGGTAMTGGRGTVWGTIAGAIILGMINNMLNLVGVSAYLQGTVKGIVVIGAVYIQRQRQ